MPGRVVDNKVFQERKKSRRFVVILYCLTVV